MTQAYSWSPNQDMNVETVKTFCWDVSWTFLNELDSIEFVTRPNRNSSNDRGEGVIGDMPLLHIEQLPSFQIERNDQEEESLKSVFKHARL